MIRGAVAGAMLLALLAGIARAADPAPAPGQPIGRWIEPSWTPVSRQARIFLVAGSRDIANFAQEVVDQKRYWLQRGYSPEQIECFFAAPDPSHRVDVEQFLALEEELKACHLAFPGTVLAAIRELAQDYPDEFFYLYLTSHGSYPALEWPEPVQRNIDPQQAWLPAALAEARDDPASQAFAWLGTYRIEMEAMRRPDGTWGWISFLDRYVNLHRRNGARAEEELLTPATLASALSAFPEHVRKIVILQGCHSGGFLLEPQEAPSPGETLVNVERITVLTAARADRTSFGCSGGDRTTYYGGALQRVLNGLPKKPIPRQDWKRVHREVMREVELLENASGLPAERRSLPQYFSNHDVRGRKRGGGGGNSRAAR
jgi:hypothetical protein